MPKGENAMTEMFDECRDSTVPQHPQKRSGNGVPFERVRRITGYLVGASDRWNNAKKAELRDRVKHTIGRI